MKISDYIPTVEGTFNRLNGYSEASKQAYGSSTTKWNSVKSGVSYHLASRIGYVATALFATVACIVNVAGYALQGISNQTIGRFTDKCKFDTGAKWNAVIANKNALFYSLSGATFGHVNAQQKPHSWACLLSFGLACSRTDKVTDLTNSPAKI